MSAIVAQNMALARARTRAECSIEAGLVQFRCKSLIWCDCAPGKAKGEKGGSREPHDVTRYPPHYPARRVTGCEPRCSPRAERTADEMRELQSWTGVDGHLVPLTQALAAAAGARIDGGRLGRERVLPYPKKRGLLKALEN